MVIVFKEANYNRDLISVEIKHNMKEIIIKKKNKKK